MKTTDKQKAPRNYVALALMKRGGSGSHQKNNKQIRQKNNNPKNWE